MPIGRPRIPGTEAERAEARRAKVRANVQAFRRRQKEKKLAAKQAAQETNDTASTPSQTPGLRHGPIGLPTISLSSKTRLQASDVAVFPPESPESWLWAIRDEVGVKIMGTSYQNAFIGALQRRFMFAQTNHEQSQMRNEPKKRFSISCSTWITVATLELGKPETEVLMEALLAASLAIIGRDRKDHDVALHGAYLQTRALQRLRYSLTRYQQGDRSICPTMLSLSALTCAMSELIANKSWDNFNRHLLGVGALIFHGGVERLSSKSAREHFYGYRAIQAPFLFMNRQRAFLSEPEWIDLPWKNELELAQHPLHLMLDVAFKLLPEIVKQNTPKKWKTAELEERLERSWEIVAELEDWENQQRSQHGGVLYTHVPAAWQGVFRQRLEFPNTSSGIAFTMYTAIRIHAANLIANISEDILSRDPTADVHPSSAELEALQWSRLACQCIEFFHTGPPKYAGRIVTLWPLETAWELFSRLQDQGFIDTSQEIGWCRATAERHAALEIPVFRWR